MANHQFGERLFGVTSQAQQLQMDPWAHAYQMRFNPKYPQYAGKEEDVLRDVEHYLYARDTASQGPTQALAMALGVPGHAALKALGIKRGDTSLEELKRGFQGVGAGIADWWRGQDPAALPLPGLGAAGQAMRGISQGTDRGVQPPAGGASVETGPAAHKPNGGIVPTIEDIGNRLWQWWMDNGNGKRPGRPL